MNFDKTVIQPIDPKVVDHLICPGMLGQGQGHTGLFA